MNSLGGRKFIVTVLTGISTSILTWYGKLDPGTYSVVTIATIGTFIAGNTYEKKVKS